MYDDYKSCKYCYKLFLKKEKGKYKDKANDSLLSDFAKQFNSIFNNALSNN